MAEKEGNIPKILLPPLALVKLQGMRQNMDLYFQGVVDGMGLTGPYSLDIRTGEICRLLLPSEDIKREG